METRPSSLAVVPVVAVSSPSGHNCRKVPLRDKFRVFFQFRGGEEIAFFLIPKRDSHLAEVANVQPFSPQPGCQHGEIGEILQYLPGLSIPFNTNGSEMTRCYRYRFASLC